MIKFCERGRGRVAWWFVRGRVGWWFVDSQRFKVWDDRKIYIKTLSASNFRLWRIIEKRYIVEGTREVVVL